MDDKCEMIGTRVTKQTRNDMIQFMEETGLFLNMSDFVRQAIREKLYSRLIEEEIRAIVRDELQKFKPN